MNNICNAPIGIFDSGIGGLTVAREVMRNIPDERIIYFGDTARVPYGSKSRNTVLKYSRQIINFLQTQDIKAIVVACNTASAYALEDIKKEIDIPIIGVVKPGARVARDTTKNGRIGVIGTEATISSGLYTQFIQEKHPEYRIFGRACPLFVPLVEEGWQKDPVTAQVATRYLDELMNNDIDTLILGCTHYPLLRSTIRKIVGDKVQLVNPAYETARELKELLKRENLVNPGGTCNPTDQHQFYVSDLADKFKKFANSILPFEIEMTNQINIEEY